MNLLLDEVNWIPKKIVADLKKEGVITLLDLVLLPNDIVKQYNFEKEIIDMIIKARENFGYIDKASEIVGIKQNRIKVNTGSIKLDTLLEGGIFSGRLTEVYGESGSGKTQLCFQLCINYQLNSKNDKKIFFIDTVGNFRPERIAEMCGNENNKDEIFKRIFTIRANNWAEQINAINKINRFTPNSVGLIIIDTVTDNLVYEFQSEKYFTDRQVALSKHLHELAITAIYRDVAIVITNTVRNRMPLNGKGYIIETGGKTISHGVHLRLKLSKIGNGWSAQLNNKSIRFKIGKKGLMDWDS